MIPILYCDIDGTIRHGKDELGRFVNTPEDVVIFDGVTELLWRYRQAGWRIVGVSNQGGIALGHMDFRTCRKAMNETHNQTRGAFDSIVWCPHHPDADTPDKTQCWCRKPKAGLVVEGAMKLQRRFPGESYPPHMGLFVGDRPEDEQCAENAGLIFMDAKEWREGKHLETLRAA